MAQLTAAPLTTAELSAFRAFAQGRAAAHQQRLVLKVILERFAGLMDLAYTPGGLEQQRHSDFNGGRQYVGQAIALAAGLRFYNFNTAEDQNGEATGGRGKGQPKGRREKGNEDAGG